tara:strand:+ start:294 stop:521 length:228 start_codon:yes stop_codon:yes gene_type:complete
MNKNKSKKGFKTMFKNINLKKLSVLELRILLNSLDSYIVDIEHGEYQYPDDKVYNMLQDFTNEICEEIQKWHEDN